MINVQKSVEYVNKRLGMVLYGPEITEGPGQSLGSRGDDMAWEDRALILELIQRHS